MFERIEKDLQILADQTRLLILQLIYQGEQCGCDLIHCIDVTQPTLSYHLKILSDAGFIRGVKEKNKVIYTFQEEKIGDVFADLMKQLTSKKGLQFMKGFDKYLTLVVLLCMAIGVFVGQYLSFIPDLLNGLTIAQVSLPIAILIWLMIYPMMLKVDFTSIKDIRKNPKGLYLTWIVNWLIKPFTMFLIAGFFFLIIYKGLIPHDLANDYLAGAIILGAAPCTAMVFVWSQLTKGNPAYTVVQVATNDLILLVLFVPIVGLLLDVGGFSIPWDTLFISVFLFVVVPLVLAGLTRYYILKYKGLKFLNDKVISKFTKLTMYGLLLTLVLIFSLQSQYIIDNPLHIILISVPLIIQTFFVFGLTYYIGYKMKLSHNIAAPAGFIGASNFFELAVAVAIALFPLNPGVALATIVGVLVEVPVMLMLVKIANKTRSKFNFSK